MQALAQEADVIAAMKAFSETFGQFRADNGLESVDELKTSVFSYYDNEFAPEYQKITGNAPDLKMAKSLGDDTIAFQYHYISTNKNLLGEKTSWIVPLINPNGPLPMQYITQSFVIM